MARKNMANVRLSRAVPRARSWDDVFARLVAFNAAGDPRAGHLFEEFCKYFFLCEPSQRDEFKNVWRDAELPPRVRRKLTIAKQEHGVDLVLEHRDGRLFAVQCKFKTDQSARLGWTTDRLSGWLSEGDEAQGLILFTNASGVDAHTERKARKKDFRLYTVGDLHKLSKETLREILQAARGRGVRKKKLATPRPFQRQAIADVARGFRSHARGQLILPCGAGKTLTSLWIKEALKGRRTLVVVPSLALLRQTKREWSANQKAWAPYLCVCSEAGIDRDVREDRPVTHTFEIQGTVTTSPVEIRRFVRHHREFVIYSTYQSLDCVARGLRATGLQLDLVIADEAHKTAGDRKGEFAFIHDAKKIRAKRRLYMTATPKITSAKLKDRLGEERFKLIADMSDPAVFGPVFHHMSFGAAIAQGILVDYKILVIGVSDRELAKAVSRRVFSRDATIDEVANNLALEKVMAKYKAAHAITFHSSIRRAQRFGERHRRFHRRTWAGHVNGGMTTNDREVLMQEFRQEPRAIMTNARCLTEGIDVPAIDCVYFCDPKSSKLDIVQASGRALRKPKDRRKDFGYVVVPVFHRDRKNIEAAIERSVFRHVVDVVRALADQDERIQLEIDMLLLGKGKRPPGRQHIRFDLSEARITILGFERALRRALFDQIIEKSTTSWDARITELLAFKRRFGHVRVPRDARGAWRRLGRWVDEVRADKRNGRLPTERISQLDELGFDWRIDGQTLDSTHGLLLEREFRELSGLKQIRLYRVRGLITPIGYAPAGPGLGIFYSPDQIEPLKKTLGITLNDTTGLMSQNEFKKYTGLSNIGRYRKRGLIEPVGNGVGKSKLGPVTPYYSPNQREPLLKALGVTLKRTKRLITAYEARRRYGGLFLRWKKHGLIKPAGKALSASHVSSVYETRALARLMKGIVTTPKKLHGLIPEKKVRALPGMSEISDYRKQGKIIPAARGLDHGREIYFYDPKVIQQSQAARGFDRKRPPLGLMTSREAEKELGINLNTYRLTGKIRPAARGRSRGGRVRFLYKRADAMRLLRTHGKTKKIEVTPDRLRDLLGTGTASKVLRRLRANKSKKGGGSELRVVLEEMGLLLAHTRNLLSEEQFIRKTGLCKIREYRRAGMIAPAGVAFTGAQRLSAFFRPAQEEELRATLRNRSGVDLQSTEGLLAERVGAKKYNLPGIASLRARGLAKPAGKGFTANGQLSFFYEPRELARLRRHRDGGRKKTV